MSMETVLIVINKCSASELRLLDEVENALGPSDYFPTCSPSGTLLKVTEEGGIVGTFLSETKSKVMIEIKPDGRVLRTARWTEEGRQQCLLAEREGYQRMLMKMGFDDPKIIENLTKSAIEAACRDWSGEELPLLRVNPTHVESAKRILREYLAIQQKSKTI